MKRNIFCSFCYGLLLAAATVIVACSTSQPPNTQVHDGRITAEVKSKLASDVRPSSLTNISVNTTNGVVTLAGQVESEEIKRNAETVARSVAGVMSINNNLQVQPAGNSKQGRLRGSPLGEIASSSEVHPLGTYVDGPPVV